MSFESTAERIGRLVTEKNQQYGAAFRQTATILEQLYPDGIKPGQYEDLGLVIRILDKLSRITHGASSRENWDDVAGYGILGSETAYDAWSDAWATAMEKEYNDSFEAEAEPNVVMRSKFFDANLDPLEGFGADD
jgi:hypothetical protein